MTKKSILFTCAVLLSGLGADAFPVVLKSGENKDTYSGRRGQVSDQLPFGVDVTFGHLTLHFEDANSLCMVVTGPDGVVLVKEVQMQAGRSAVYDLTPYRDGNYQIRLIDVKGNDVSGEFLKQADGLGGNQDKND